MSRSRLARGLWATHGPRLSPRKLILGSRSVSTASPEELAHFARLADSWWDPNGSQRILHKMNLLRLDYIRDTLARYSKGNLPGYSLDLLPADAKAKYLDASMGSGWEVLDVGCGGGLLSESMARLDEVKSVRGIDLTPEVVSVAEAHKKLDPKLTDKLDYRLVGVDQLDKSESYDLVTMFEILEHVPEPAKVLEAAMAHVRPGGWLFLSTINRTPVAYLTTIFAAEQVLRIVPSGTHSYDKYINEAEIRDWLAGKKDWQFVRSDGCLYVPLAGWQLTSYRGLGNYFLAARKADAPETADVPKTESTRKTPGTAKKESARKTT